jgi:SAM-dependent methyltransferase
VNDLPGALIQLRRALAPDGLLLASLPGLPTLGGLRNALAEAESFGLNLPTLQNTRDRFDHLVHEMDGAGLDHAALYLELLARNGLTAR